jgi:hypothetical protein
MRRFASAGERAALHPGQTALLQREARAQSAFYRRAASDLQKRSISTRR